MGTFVFGTTADLRGQYLLIDGRRICAVDHPTSSMDTRLLEPLKHTFTPGLEEHDVFLRYGGIEAKVSDIDSLPFDFEHIFLVRTLLDDGVLHGQQRVIDMACGAGFIGTSIAQHMDHVDVIFHDEETLETVLETYGQLKELKTRRVSENIQRTRDKNGRIVDFRGGPPSYMGQLSQSSIATLAFTRFPGSQQELQYVQQQCIRYGSVLKRMGGVLYVAHSSLVTKEVRNAALVLGATMRMRTKTPNQAVITEEGLERLAQLFPPEKEGFPITTELAKRGMVHGFPYGAQSGRPELKSAVYYHHLEVSQLSWEP